MARLVFCALSVLLVGCRAPAPSFDMLAPYGSPTVPPPATGRVGTAGGYYPPATPSPPPAGAIPSPSPMTTPLPASTPQSPAVLPPGAYMGASTAPYTTLSDARVAPASFDAQRFTDGDSPARASGGELVFSPLPRGGTTGAASSLRLNGMRATDATQLGEPHEFMPPRDTLPLLPSAPGGLSTPQSYLRVIDSHQVKAPGTASSVTSEPVVASGSWQSR